MIPKYKSVDVNRLLLLNKEITNLSNNRLKEKITGLVEEDRAYVSDVIQVSKDITKLCKEIEDTSLEMLDKFHEENPSHFGVDKALCSDDIIIGFFTRNLGEVKCEDCILKIEENLLNIIKYQLNNS